MAERVTSNEGFIHPTEKMKVNADANVVDGIAGALREFVNALRTGQTPQGECHDNIKSLAMVFAAIEIRRNRTARENHGGLIQEANARFSG